MIFTYNAGDFYQFSNVHSWVLLHSFSQLFMFILIFSRITYVLFTLYQYLKPQSPPSWQTLSGYSSTYLIRIVFKKKPMSLLPANKLDSILTTRAKVRWTKEYCPFSNCSVPGTLNSAWHMVGTQWILADWRTWCVLAQGITLVSKRLAQGDPNLLPSRQQWIILTSNS